MAATARPVSRFDYRDRETRFLEFIGYAKSGNACTQYGDAGFGAAGEKGRFLLPLSFIGSSLAVSGNQQTHGHHRLVYCRAAANAAKLFQELASGLGRCLLVLLLGH